MNAAEVQQLLVLAAALERRRGQDAEVSDTERMAWVGMLPDVTLADGLAAVREHYSRSRWPISVAEVLEHSARVRSARLEATPVDRLALPEHLDPDDVRAYLAWRRQATEEVAAGTYVAPAQPLALVAGPVDVSRVLGTVTSMLAARRAKTEREARERHDAAEAQRVRQLGLLVEAGALQERGAGS